MSNTKKIWRLLEAGEIPTKDDEIFVCSEWRRGILIQGVPLGNSECLVRRLETVPQWPEAIRTSERMPTKEDANEYNSVLAFGSTYGWATIHYANVGPGRYDLWLPLPPAPPPEKSEAEKAWDERRKSTEMTNATSFDMFEVMKREFAAGFEAARKEKK